MRSVRGSEAGQEAGQEGGHRDCHAGRGLQRPGADPEGEQLYRRAVFLEGPGRYRIPGRVHRRIQGGGGRPGLPRPADSRFRAQGTAGPEGFREGCKGEIHQPGLEYIHLHDGGLGLRFRVGVPQADQAFQDGPRWRAGPSFSSRGTAS